MLLAHVESANCPVAYQGLKITTSLSYVSMIFSESIRISANAYFSKTLDITNINGVPLTKSLEFLLKTTG
ncbi:hypothetical protein [Bathymodiolus japonicus methanotrophic gill symbiont]|uniref:hypothetical protein n=1 Tax=Bathymodiolus japonicus methanotrophic gill symbiont TaxID=113269 RepID=UPI001C8DC5A3|nr:hypothetical protein [Bathymodiolus japonicus methanotrophic gill symbiont]